MKPEHHEIARYLSRSSRTARRYRLARIEEMSAGALDRSAVGASSRVEACFLALAAPGSNRAWGGEL